MTVDKPAMRLDYRPTAVVTPTEAMAKLLDALADGWPEYQPVVHLRYGTYGVIRDDSPANVPHEFDGRPRRVCLGPDGETWISVLWSPGSALPLRAWAPARLLKPTGRRW